MTQDAAAGPARPSRPLVLSADGGTAPLIDAEPLDERRPPRIPRRLLAAALVALLLLTGSAVGTRAVADVDPTAFAVFEGRPSVADLQAAADLAGIGAPVIGEARVLATAGSVTVVAVRAPGGTGARLRESGGFPSSGGPIVADPLRSGDTAETVVVPDSAEVCLWILSQRAGPSGRCASPQVFTAQGLAGSITAETLETVAFWAPNGSADVATIPFGPTSLDDVRALGIPALEILETLPLDVDDVAERNPQAGDPFGESVIALRALAGFDGWRMSAGVFRPEPDGGLAVCVRLAPEERYGEFASSCTAVARFAEFGAGGGMGIQGENIEWQWGTDGSARLTAEEE